MSEPEDFLSRWSRRKREAVEKTDDAQAHEPARAFEGETPAAETKPPAVGDKPAEAPFDLKTLPPIESITAATDIRPFLVPGVPAELARAALRRAWSADPSIRDFVGLAEYAWDYHQPGSMAGFGPLEMTDELRKTVARIIGEISDEDKSGAPQTALPAVGEAENPSDIKSEMADSRAQPTTVGEVQLAQASPANRQDVAGEPEQLAPSHSSHTAVQHQSTELETIPLIVRRGHGRALPK
jgi:hypothetical protein